MAVDISKWLTDNMNALSLSDDEKVLAQKLASGEFGKRLGGTVYPQQSVSDLQSKLDTELNAKRTLEADNIAWQNQYWKDVSELGGVDRLEAAGFDISGLRAAPGGGVHNQQGQALTAAEITALIQQEAKKLVEPVRQGTLDFAEFVAVAAADYREAYGKRFDPKKFREYAFENRADFANLQQAYDSFTADDRKVKEESEKKKWETDKEKEIELRVMSRLQIPEVSPESGVGGPFDIAMKSPASTSAATGTAPPPSGASGAPVVTSREENRQNFAKKFQGTDFSGL